MLWTFKLTTHYIVSWKKKSNSKFSLFLWMMRLFWCKATTIQDLMSQNLGLGIVFREKMEWTAHLFLKELLYTFFHSEYFSWSVEGFLWKVTKTYSVCFCGFDKPRWEVKFFDPSLPKIFFLRKLEKPPIFTFATASLDNTAVHHFTSDTMLVFKNFSIGK